MNIDSSRREESGKYKFFSFTQKFWARTTFKFGTVNLFYYSKLKRGPTSKYLGKSKKFILFRFLLSRRINIRQKFDEKLTNAKKIQIKTKKFTIQISFSLV